MARVRFLRDFAYHLPETNARVTKTFKAGQEATVRKDIAEAAVADGAAELVGGGSENDNAGEPAQSES